MKRVLLAFGLAVAVCGAASAQEQYVTVDGGSSVTVNGPATHLVWGAEASATQAGVMIVTPTSSSPSSPISPAAPVCVPMEPVPSGGTQTYASWFSNPTSPPFWTDVTVTISSDKSCSTLTPVSTGTHITLWYQ